MAEQASYELELTSADIPGTLDCISKAGILIRDVIRTGDLTVRLTIRRQDYASLLALTQRRGDSLRRIRRIGAYWKYQRLFSHPVLILSVILIVFLTVFLPSRVLIIQVEGNESVPANLILETASECGVYFGACRSEVRNERIKNRLLDEIPQLQWVGVNTSGCVATISVRERTQSQEEQAKGVGSIVAVRDGVIRECTVVRGTALCKVGQAVREGDVLISGYTDCGGAILASLAEGEVYAETNHQIQVKTSAEQVLRGEVVASVTRISLRILKNKINFYKDSGILDATCVKMEKEYYLTLPGGFRLPFALVVEQWVSCDLSTDPAEPQAVQQTLSDYADEYLRGKMVAGQILQRQENFDEYTLYGNYVCREMIGQIRYEEITNEYGKINGENG